jgi:hypothetical protein
MLKPDPFHNIKEKMPKPLGREFMLHKQQMEIKTQNGTSVKTEALWKRKN